MPDFDIEFVYESNGRRIGPGFRNTRIEDNPDGTQTMSVMVDHVTEKFSPIIGVLKDAIPDEIPIPAPPAPDPAPAPVPLPPVGQANVRNAAELAVALSTAVSGTILVLKGNNYGVCPDIPNGVSIMSADLNNRAQFAELNVVGKHDIVLEGLHLKYTPTRGDIDATNRFLCQNSQRITYRNCAIEGGFIDGVGKGRGLRLWGSNSDILIEDCEVFNLWKGLGLNGNNITVIGCDIHTIRSDGINTGVGSNFVIDNCYFHDFGTLGGKSDHRDMIQAIGSATGITIKNCLFDQNNGQYAQGIWSDANSPDSDLHIIDNLFIMSHRNCLAWINFNGGDISGNIVIQWFDDQGQPRPDNNPKVAIPKINMAGDNFIFARNVAPGITNPTTYDSTNVVEFRDDKVARAQARTDDRWKGFFGG